MVDESKSFNFSIVIAIQLLGPANFFLNFFKTFKQENVKVGVNSHPSVRLPSSSVLEHETHALLINFEGSDCFP